MSGPSVVAFWRGTWDYANIWYDKVLFQGDLDLSNALAIILGLILNFLLDMFHRSVQPLAGKVRDEVREREIRLSFTAAEHSETLGSEECVQRPLRYNRYITVESEYYH